MTKRRFTGHSIVGLTRRTLVVTGIGTLAAPVALRSARGDAPQHIMRLGYSDVSSSPFRKVLDGFADDVRQRTNGAVSIKVYASGELGSQNNIFTGMQTGIIDFAAHVNGFMQTLFPRLAILDFPYLFADRAVAAKVLDGPVGQQLFADMPAKGIYGLSWIDWGWRQVTTVDKPVPHPADMRGVKIRVMPGAIYAATYKALGAVPISIDVSEIYVALSQRAADALEVPLISLVAQKNYEVAHVTNETNFDYNAGALMASKRRFDVLEKPQQDAIRQAAIALSGPWREMTVQLTDQATAFLKTKGQKFLPVDIDAYRAATRPVYDQFRGSIGPEFVSLVLKQVASA